MKLHWNEETRYIHDGDHLVLGRAGNIVAEVYDKEVAELICRSVNQACMKPILPVPVLAEPTEARGLSHKLIGERERAHRTVSQDRLSIDRNRDSRGGQKSKTVSNKASLTDAASLTKARQKRWRDKNKAKCIAATQAWREKQ